MPEFGYNDRDGMVTRSYRKNDFVDTKPDELVVSESRSQDARTVYAPDHIRRIMAIPARKRKSSQKRALKKWRDARRAQAGKDAQVSRNQVATHNRSWAGKVRSESDDKRVEYRHIGVTTGGNRVANTSRTGVEMIFWASDQHNDADRAARVVSIPSNGRYDEHAGMPGVVDVRTSFDGRAGRWVSSTDQRRKTEHGPNGAHTTHDARHKHLSDCNYGDECTHDGRKSSGVPELEAYAPVGSGVGGLGRLNDNWTRAMERRADVVKARAANRAYVAPRGICESDFE